MSKMDRALPAFALGYAVYYAIAFVYNSGWLPLFTYYPAINGFAWGFAVGNDDIGPPMHWYGWLINAAMAGGVLGVLATFLPAKLAAKFLPVAAWAVPLAAMAFLAYYERFFFGL